MSEIHTDTERLDWLSANTDYTTVEIPWPEVITTLRAAIDWNIEQDEKAKQS